MSTVERAQSSTRDRDRRARLGQLQDLCAARSLAADPASVLATLEAMVAEEAA